MTLAVFQRRVFGGEMMEKLKNKDSVRMKNIYFKM